jgi:hypothetical protein
MFNNLISKIKKTDLLFFDVETAAQQPTLKKTDSIYPMVAYKFRDRDTGKELPFKDVKDKYIKEGALHPSLNKIICIVVGVISGNKLRTKKLVGEEKYIIEDFYKYAENRVLAGHNIKSFDLPLIRLRSIANGIEVPPTLDDRLLKPWDVGLESNAKLKIVDSMDINKGTYFNNISLVETCYLLGVESPKLDIKGSEVNMIYHKEGVDRITDYCVSDVLASANVILKLIGEAVVELYLVKDESEQEKETKEEAIVNIWKKLDADKTLTKKTEAEIKKILGVKKLNKDHKKFVVDIITAAIYFDGGDNPGEQDSKYKIEAKRHMVENTLNLLTWS